MFFNEAVQISCSLVISSRLLQVPFPKQTMLGIDDIVENATPIPVPANVTTSANRNTQIMVEEDSITSSVQYCCDGCSTIPILRRRWHCIVCPDFDLCKACYEVLDVDRLPPHYKDHPMSAIPIEVEPLGGEGNEIHFSTDDLSDSSLLPVHTIHFSTNITTIHFSTDELQNHIDRNADITISCVPMGDSHASDYGLMKIDHHGRRWTI